MFETKVSTYMLCLALFLCIPRSFAAHQHSGTSNKRSQTDWPTYGRTYSESRYSPLATINDSNVNKLGLAWYLDLPKEGTLESTPLEVNGILFFSGTFGRAFAVDGLTGRKLWEFDPELSEHSPRKLRLNMGANRGIAYWDGRVYVGTNDGRLVALDAKDGKVAWCIDTIDAKEDNPKFISGAPRAFDGKVVIGNGNAEAGTRGYVSAYDARDGHLLWRFYTVPHTQTGIATSQVDSMMAKTWSGPPEKWGGGSVWDSIVYDPDLNLVYIATGNGNPVNAEIRSPGQGDNLFLSSIVALNASTGTYVWHYQVNPRDSWDFDATQQLILADLLIGGNLQKVLMQAPKNGFFYVINRKTGKLISAEKYTKVTWAKRIDLATGRPMETPGSRYKNAPFAVWPGPMGAHNWQPMSFNPDTRLVYIPTMKLGAGLAPPTNDELVQLTDGSRSTKGPVFELQLGVDNAPYVPDPDDGTGSLLAWDPVLQVKKWEVRYDTLFNGGTLSSGGNLVFQGTGRGEFAAYRATTGEKLWSFATGLGIIAAPITYEIGAHQYVSVLVGYGGSAAGGGKEFDYGWRFKEQVRRLLTFSMEGNTSLPAGKPPRFEVHAADNPSIHIDKELAARGAIVYSSNFCWMCHGEDLRNSGSIAPDLRESELALSFKAFETILHTGSLANSGMPKYDDLNSIDLRALYMYVRQSARKPDMERHELTTR